MNTFQHHLATQDTNVNSICWYAHCYTDDKISVIFRRAVLLTFKINNPETELKETITSHLTQQNYSYNISSQKQRQSMWKVNMPIKSYLHDDRKHEEYQCFYWKYPCWLLIYKADKMVIKKKKPLIWITLSTAEFTKYHTIYKPKLYILTSSLCNHSLFS